jgi:hypothetical protein
MLIVVFDRTKITFFQLLIFQFLVIKALDPDWIRIRITIQPKMLDSDPHQMHKTLPYSRRHYNISPLSSPPFFPSLFPCLTFFMIAYKFLEKTFGYNGRTRLQKCCSDTVVEGRKFPPFSLYIFLQ